ncbi:bifunctional NUDIX hydrolase/histidine phosphatase family protein [Corynebacterium ulcerans]|uniref:NUDIX hydrolase n=1 Tax=Corynebacterium ulcerans TaxID=65058 RepID=UPI0018D88437|nr:bifunctional NUDIX hydrolase/histidine phosphatase family protein [Corynebacterium ulcerans]MBH5295557.1 NUDIX hydrolase [Corynebacterium ulcerans]MDK8889371.1 bifunctional NUDIX hydrolase/histidine phosphatase family protein [Corynebacterium ulcerans]
MHKTSHTEATKDQQSSLAITGRFQSIVAEPAQEYSRPTLAAGAVLWRSDHTDPDSIQYAVIHRPHYDDWSLAKGKVDPGESLPVTAAREIVEETGFRVRLGKLLGKVTYPVGDRTKVVYYWTAEVLDGAFTPNNEVDEIRWLDFHQARELLSYDVDKNIMDKARKRFEVPATTRILYVRHARAFRRSNWAGNDNLRPLDKKGRRQAQLLAPLLEAFRPTAIYSALPDRCQQTAAPLAKALDLEVSVDATLGDEGWLSAMTDSQAAFSRIIDQGGVSVVVAQGMVIPDTIAWLSASGRLPLEEIPAKKASVWVLSFTNGELTGADYLASPLPAK